MVCGHRVALEAPPLPSVGAAPTDREPLSKLRLSASVCITMAYANLPPVGWNLTTTQTITGLTVRPVSTSFGKSHPTRSGAPSSCVMGKQVQRLGPRASVPSSKDPQLMGISTKVYDQYGSIGQCSRIAHKAHAGKPGSNMEDWTKRNGFGEMPAYLRSSKWQQQLRADATRATKASSSGGGRVRTNSPQPLYTSSFAASQALESYDAYMRSQEDMAVPWRDYDSRGLATTRRGGGGSHETSLPAIASSPALPLPTRPSRRHRATRKRSPGIDEALEPEAPPELSPRSRLLEAAATVALRRTQSDPDFVKAERLKRTQLMPRWQHPSPPPMGRAGE